VCQQAHLPEGVLAEGLRGGVQSGVAPAYRDASGVQYNVKRRQRQGGKLRVGGLAGLGVHVDGVSRQVGPRRVFH
jgi:hypothetical protein